MERPNCPKCGKLMVKGAKTATGRIRWRCESFADGVRTICTNTTNPLKPQAKRFEREQKLYFDQPLKKRKIIVTCAQNATPVEANFWASLLALKGDIDAQMMVVPIRYKNPTSTWPASQENAQWWDPAFRDYLVNRRVELCPGLVLLADIHVRPTAELPLSGFEGITHAESGILAHPKLQLQCIPTVAGQLPKIMTTTGAATKANYTDSKEGKKGEFHHVFGAAVIEIDGDDFHIHHINANSDGAFVFFHKAYYPDGSICAAGPAQGLIFGDAHPLFSDPLVVEGTWGRGGLVDVLNPEVEVFHDVMDSYSVNPHHEGNPFIALAKMQSGKNDAKWETDFTIDWMKEKVGHRQAIVVPSNHDNMLARWVRKADWKQDPTNMIFYLKTALYMAENTYMSERGVMTPDPFVYWLKQRQFPNIRGLEPGEKFSIADIKLDLHGHEGPDGTRGSIKNLSKIGSKTIIGHSHKPGIFNGCWQTGTKTYLSLEYTGPVSSWHNADISIDAFGKRHLHFFVNGRFRA